jgi:hypothetical protein
MTDRKKKGIGFFVSGGVFVAAGAVFTFMSATPEWFVTTIQVIGIVAGALGFKLVFPDVED